MTDEEIWDSTMMHHVDSRKIKQYCFKFTDRSYPEAWSYVRKNNITFTTREFWNTITVNYDDKYLHNLCVKLDIV